MGKLFYLETRPGCVQKVIDVLQSKGLCTGAIETHYIGYQRGMHGELIMWTDNYVFPAFVHKAQENIITRCGIKVEY